MANDYARLCTAVGRLFLNFGQLEGVLAATLRLHLAGKINPKVEKGLPLASAIYGGMRFKAARDTIKRVMEQENSPARVQKFVMDVMAHLKAIETFRDKLAHQLVVPVHDDHLTSDGDWQVADHIVSRDIRNPLIYVFKIEMVEAAADDLMAAANRFGKQAKVDKLFDAVDLSAMTWRYKPSALKLQKLSLKLPQKD